MKIAVLCGHYPYSGAGVIAFESAKELSRRHSVTFVHGGEANSDRQDDGMRIVSLQLPPEPERGAWQLYWSPKVIRRLGGLLDRLQPDIVHFHIVQRRSFSLAALLLSRRFRSLWTLHDQWHLCVRSVPEPPSCEGMRRFCLFCSTWPGISLANKLLKEAVFAASPLEVVVPSRWLGELTRYSMLGRKKVHLVYNGVDLGRFCPSAAVESPTREGGALKLLFVAGPNDPTKGLSELLQAFALLRERIPGMRLRVVGEPAPGVGEREGVEVVGKIPREKMPEEYRRCDLFVLPTLADNTPVTLMEAMASGLPVIATSVGGIPELVSEGVTGSLVPRGDVGALARAIERLATEPGMRNRMGMEARVVAETRFGKERMARDLETIYESGTRDAPELDVKAVVSAAGGRR
ncbi:MAG TPA: glycosyltransferase family 4 protein [Candidatus Polarisedimenticolia bacterium]|nr:glycosyltransferase family 4 protein [Candidatus Polarisedimenticolia bacterium]